MMPTRKKSAPHRGAPPARAGKASTSQIGIRVTLEERDRWQAAADKGGTTLSNIAREAWERFAKRASKS